MPPALPVEYLAPAPKPGNIVRVCQVEATWAKKRQSVHVTIHSLPVGRYLIPYGVWVRME